jgi:AAA+ ATPase superfamily predicted ATPase
MDSVKPTHGFVNRFRELAALERTYANAARTGQLTLVSGRRRLGKTFLLQRFVAGHDARPAKPHAYHLADQSNAAVQRATIASEILATFPDPGTSISDIAVSWNSLLRHVARLNSPDNAPIVWILDEFPYLVEQTPELPSILQSWWDREGVHSRLMVVLCGSKLSAMRALGTATAPLYGRFSGGMLEIQPFDYRDTSEFTRGFPHYDAPKKVALYGILGGTPRYHALVDPRRDPETVVCDLILRHGAPLQNEIEFLLGSEQIRNPAPFHAILSAVARGETQFAKIQNAACDGKPGAAHALATLVDLGWIRRETPFEETSQRRALYTVADPFVRFWYSRIHPHASSLAFRDVDDVYHQRIAPGLDDYLGRNVFETVCHQWLRRDAEKKLGLRIEDAGRWWSRDGQLEFDIVGRTDTGRTLFGECKWSVAKPVGIDAWAKLIAKVERHPDPRWKHEPHFILFAMGGFTDELATAAAKPDNRLHLVGPELLLP